MVCRTSDYLKISRPVCVACQILGLAFLYGWCWTYLAAHPVAAATPEDLEQRFHNGIVPLMKEFCIECHQGDDAEAMLNLDRYQRTADVARDHQTWAELRHRLERREMPPADAQPQPTDDQRRAFMDWIDAFRKHQADLHAGDPGSVPVRRLSNSEMNYTIRDLTGVDIRPTREFPVDPANEAGFDNSAESLTMSPALVNKYLAAARYVAEHMVLTPDGIDFAPHPVVTDTDRDKYCVKRIIEFYQRQNTDLADYFYAAWEHRVRGDDQSLEQRAERHGLSRKYFKQVFATLTADGPTMPYLETPAEGTELSQAPAPIALGPLAVVRRMWLNLPENEQQSAEARSGCAKLRDFVIDLRKRLEPDVRDITMNGIHKGAQPFVLWKNGQYAAYRQLPNLEALRKLSPGADSRAIADALSVPEEAAELEKFVGEVKRFCRIFPDAFYVSERGRDYVGLAKSEQEKGRLLSAGFHSMMGYYRDDQPLMNLMLDWRQRAELDRLWQELDFVTSAPMRQYTGFVWFERTDSRTMRDPEFDFARAEDKEVTTPAMIERLAETYLAKAERLGASEVAVTAIEEFFRRINEQIQWVERTRRSAEPHHLNALIDFADRAFRRDLTADERGELRTFYEMLRRQDGLSHEEAVQDVLVSILMSPAFSYRVDLAATTDKRASLTDEELASRLSYFLWSSLPDEELRKLAREKLLHQPQTLRGQVRRMLSDQRSRGLAVEFGGQWLDFRRFEAHNSVDRERFPTFDDQLRSAMFEEPVRFLEHMMRSDRPITDCLNADYVIINAALAKHYGVKDFIKAHEGSGHEETEIAGDRSRSAADPWQLIPAARAPGRGGLLTMSVFLTQNAPGRRTSPVKRGYWVVKRLLGERIPPPPPNVPELPTDEAQLGELTLRETLAKHREHQSCAGCHNRFDSIGLVFENYGPIGEHRERDLAGNLVDVRAAFPNGEEGVGVESLRNYLREHRQQEFVDNLARKLLSFALGRTLLLSDESLIERMQADLKANDNRFGSLIETIVLSPQFLTKRGTADLATE